MPHWLRFPLDPSIDRWPVLAEILAECSTAERLRIHRWLWQNGNSAISYPTEVVPDEIFARIFEYVDLTALGRVEQVCRRWRALVSIRHWVQIHHGLVLVPSPGPTDPQPGQSLAGWKDRCKRLLEQEKRWQGALATTHRKLHSDRIGGLRFYCLGSECRVISSSYDRTIQMRCLSDNSRLWEIEGPTVSCLEVDQDQSLLAAGSFNRSLSLYSMTSKSLCWVAEDLLSAVTSLAFCGAYIYAGLANGLLLLLDARNGRSLASWVIHDGKIVKVLSFKTLSRVRPVEPPDDTVQPPSVWLLVTASVDGSCKLWDTTDTGGIELARLISNPGPVLDIRKCGSTLLIGCPLLGIFAHVLSQRSEDCQSWIPLDTLRYFDVVGNMIITVDADETVLWHRRCCRRLLTLPAPSDITGLYSVNESCFVTTHGDGRIAVYQCIRGERCGG
ncbi:WD40-repeat-containing domain protein [Polychytrium aggregatum]|uniref:WD40-repeat-containing domain protein n=1 Tax=Polychytrium aggregatum TaxID=110093 RepID=UPI0022FE8913|nr:WD40-repeat-containing domain protein [Polychytrium aggregatum]KAI9203410.1 WD40-repeat-containing domain protein [Polychytrium aggregatum]